MCEVIPSRVEQAECYYIKEGIRFDIIGIERYEINWWTITIKIKDKDYKGIIMIELW